MKEYKMLNVIGCLMVVIIVSQFEMIELIEKKSITLKLAQYVYLFLGFYTLMIILKKE